MDKIFKFLQKLMLLIDSIIILFILIFFIITSVMEGGLFLISYSNVDIYGYLFYYLLGKIFIGFIAFIILSIKYKLDFIKTSLYIIIQWIIFTVLMFTYDILLIKNNIYGGTEILVYIIIISIGTLILSKVLLYEIELKKPIKILYNLFSIITNYLMIIIIHILSGI